MSSWFVVLLLVVLTLAVALSFLIWTLRETFGDDGATTAVATWDNADVQALVPADRTRQPYATYEQAKVAWSDGAASELMSLEPSLPYPSRVVGDVYLVVLSKTAEPNPSLSGKNVAVTPDARDALATLASATQTVPSDVRLMSMDEFIGVEQGASKSCVDYFVTFVSSASAFLRTRLPTTYHAVQFPGAAVAQVGELRSLDVAGFPNVVVASGEALLTAGKQVRLYQREPT